MELLAVRGFADLLDRRNQKRDAQDAATGRQDDHPADDAKDNQNGLVFHGDSSPPAAVNALPPKPTPGCDCPRG